MAAAQLFRRGRRAKRNFVAFAVAFFAFFVILLALPVKRRFNIVVQPCRLPNCTVRLASPPRRSLGRVNFFLARCRATSAASSLDDPGWRKRWDWLALQQRNTVFTPLQDVLLRLKRRELGVVDAGEVGDDIFNCNELGAADGEQLSLFAFGSAPRSS